MFCWRASARPRRRFVVQMMATDRIRGLGLLEELPHRKGWTRLPSGRARPWCVTRFWLWFWLGHSKGCRKRIGRYLEGLPLLSSRAELLTCLGRVLGAPAVLGRVQYNTTPTPTRDTNTHSLLSSPRDGRTLRSSGNDFMLARFSLGFGLGHSDSRKRNHVKRARNRSSS